MELRLDARLNVRHAVVITLARRPERYAAFTQRWQALTQVPGSEVELTRLWGYDGAERAPHLGTQAGEYGCLQSHTVALRSSPSGPDAPLLIFEDDAVFDPDLLMRIQGMYLPGDWEILWLGAQHALRPDPVSVNGEYSGLVRARHALRTHAFVVRRPRAVLRYLSPRAGAVDTLLATMPTLGKYALYPGIVAQDAGASDTSDYVSETVSYWNEHQAPDLTGLAPDAGVRDATFDQPRSAVRTRVQDGARCMTTTPSGGI